jgi:hypothetical protein
MERLSETAGFALGFEEAEDVVFADCLYHMLDESRLKENFGVVELGTYRVP